MPMKLASWNINGIRAASSRGLVDFIRSSDFDLILLQEIKAEEDQIPAEVLDSGYQVDVLPAERKGYSGVMALFRENPVSIHYGIGDRTTDSEGRVQRLEYKDFYLVNTYFPNSQRGLARLDYKIEFDNMFLDMCQQLRKEKPVIVCGDFNVAHHEIDIARPKDNVKNAGFTQQERDWMTRFLEAGYVDTFRMFNSDGGNYTWWTYRFNARSRNIGWRIDYFVVSSELKEKVKSAGILQDVQGSDHVPVTLELSD